MDRIRVGVVGVGYLGRFHAEKYAKMEEADLCGVADVDPDRAREVADHWGTRAFPRASDLLGRVDAVSICVPTPLHHDVARECFLSGVDVLLEKPVTRTLDEADSLVELAASRGRIFQVGHVERFNGAFEAAAGAVQGPRLVESLRLSPFPARGIDVDVVLDLMIHDLDILLALVDSRVTEVRAAGLPVLTPLVDVASAWISFANGCAAHLTASRVSEEKVRATRVYQAGGFVTIDFLARKAFLTETKAPEAGDGPREMKTSEFPSTKGDALEREIRSFIACVASRQRPRVSGEDGRRALELAIEIGRRARETSDPEMAISHG